MFCCVLHLVFHIFILIYTTIILSTLIGWCLSVLINDMLCYVMLHFSCTNGCVFDSGHYDEVLSELFTRLWDCDVNRCEPEHDYSLDLQGI